MRSRLSCIRGYYLLRSQKWLARQRSNYVKTESHQNDRARRHYLLFYHLHIPSDSRVLSGLREGADPSKLIHSVCHPHLFHPAHLAASPRDRERRLPPDHDITIDDFPQESGHLGKRLVALGNDNHTSHRRTAICGARDQQSLATVA